MTTTTTRQPIRRSVVGRHPITAFLLLAYALTVAVVVTPFPEEIGARWRTSSGSPFRPSW